MGQEEERALRALRALGRSLNTNVERARRLRSRAEQFRVKVMDEVVSALSGHAIRTTTQDGSAFELKTSPEGASNGSPPPGSTVTTSNSGSNPIRTDGGGAHAREGRDVEPHNEVRSDRNGNGETARELPKQPDPTLRQTDAHRSGPRNGPSSVPSGEPSISEPDSFSEAAGSMSSSSSAPTELLLLSRDPEWGYVSWSIPLSRIGRAAAGLARPQARLRVKDGERVCVDEQVTPSQGRYFFRWPESESRAFTAELVIRAADGHETTLARSSEVLTDGVVGASEPHGSEPVFVVANRARQWLDQRALESAAPSPTQAMPRALVAGPESNLAPAWSGEGEAPRPGWSFGGIGLAASRLGASWVAASRGASWLGASRMGASWRGVTSWPGWRAGLERVELAGLPSSRVSRFGGVGASWGLWRGAAQAVPSSWERGVGVPSSWKKGIQLGLPSAWSWNAEQSVPSSGRWAAIPSSRIGVPSAWTQFVPSSWSVGQFQVVPASWGVRGVPSSWRARGIGARSHASRGVVTAGGVPSSRAGIGASWVVPSSKAGVGASWVLPSSRMEVERKPTSAMAASARGGPWTSKSAPSSRTGALEASRLAASRKPSSALGLHAASRSNSTDSRLVSEGPGEPSSETRTSASWGLELQSWMEEGSKGADRFRGPAPGPISREALWVGLRPRPVTLYAVDAPPESDTPS